MIKSNIFYTNGGQVNIAPGGAITATQNNGLDQNKMMQLIKDLRAAIPVNTDEKEKEAINESITVIEEELIKEKPRKNYLNVLLNGLKGIIRTAEFGAAVAAIVQFVQGLNTLNG